jgi:hypothetical protein
MFRVPSKQAGEIKKKRAAEGLKDKIKRKGGNK